jgi:hypothetical protein
MSDLSINPTSPTFWTALAGAASVVCGAVGAGNLAQPIDNVLVAIGGLLIAIVGHHTTKAAVAASVAKKAAATPWQAKVTP